MKIRNSFLIFIGLIIITLLVWYANSMTTEQTIEIKNNSIFKVVVYAQENEPTSEGTAFAIDYNTILTNYHVVKYPQKILLFNQNGVEIEAKLKAYDVKTDLAILEISTNINLNILPLSNENVQVNDIVYVANKGRIEKGKIKGTMKTLPGYNESILKYFQITNILVENGSSGSPVLNENGEVVSIVSAKIKINDELITYAIPIVDAKVVIDSIKKNINYHHNILGIETEELLNKNNNNFPSIIVTKIYDNTPAQKILKKGDVIKSFNRKEILFLDDLEYEVFKAINDQEHSIKILRDGKKLCFLFKFD